MKVFAISDLHLSINSNKPMNIFGPVWENYLEEIENSWSSLVTENDLVLISGDISWAMKLNDAKADLNYLSKFSGKKVIIKGNHDYWWSTISGVRSLLPENLYALQNDALRFGNYVVCGSRGWTVPEITHKTEDDEKIYKRELIRMELSLKSALELKQDGDTLIVMMHYPPFNSKLEENDFTKLFEQFGVDIVVYGHLHSYDKKQRLITYINNIKYYLTSCDLVGNKLIEIIK